MQHLFVEIVTLELSSVKLKLFFPIFIGQTVNHSQPELNQSLRFKSCPMGHVGYNFLGQNKPLISSRPESSLLFNFSFRYEVDFRRHPSSLIHATLFQSFIRIIFRRHRRRHIFTLFRLLSDQDSGVQGDLNIYTSFFFFKFNILI